MKLPGISERMKKNYEDIWKLRLPMRMPIILRVDGRAFHTLTKKMNRPFDDLFINRMIKTAAYLCTEIQGAQVAYVQSDEISILIHTYKRLGSRAWFDNELQKIVSISAAIASSFFSIEYNKPIQFDSRAFVIPEDEVCNYFIWRQQDWARNSIMMLARSFYTHEECQGKKGADLQDMCFQKGSNWNNLPIHLKRGSCVIQDVFGRWCADMRIPIFTKNREYIEQYLECEIENEITV